MNRCPDCAHFVKFEPEPKEAQAIRRSAHVFGAHNYAGECWAHPPQLQGDHATSRPPVRATDGCGVDFRAK
jgi:hypothetical protein